MSTDFTDHNPEAAGLPAIDTHRSVLVLEPAQSHIGLAPVPLIDPSGYVLGQSDDCDLVIRAQGIQPRHCEIYFDQGALCVRAWDDKSWLNDMPLLDSRLQDGDRLSLGPVEFRVRPATSDELLIDQLKRDQDVNSALRSRHRDAGGDGGSDIASDEQYRTLLRFLSERQWTLSDLLQMIDNLHQAESRILHAQRKEELIKELTSELQVVATELREQEEYVRSDLRSSDKVKRDELAEDLEQLNTLRSQLIDEREDWESHRQSALDQIDVRENQIADYERALDHRSSKWETDRDEAEYLLRERRIESQKSQIQRIRELDKRAQALHERELKRGRWEAELEHKECELAAGWQVVQEQQAMLLEAISSLHDDPESIESELNDLRAHLTVERIQLERARLAFLKRCHTMGVDLGRDLPSDQRPDELGPLRPAEWDASSWTEATVRELLVVLRGLPVRQDEGWLDGGEIRVPDPDLTIQGSGWISARRRPQPLGLRYLLCANAIGLGALLFVEVRYGGTLGLGPAEHLEAMGWAAIAIGGLGLVEDLAHRAVRRLRRMRFRWPGFRRLSPGNVADVSVVEHPERISDESAVLDWEREGEAVAAIAGDRDSTLGDSTVGDSTVGDSTGGDDA